MPFCPRAIDGGGLGLGARGRGLGCWKVLKLLSHEHQKIGPATELGPPEALLSLKRRKSTQTGMKPESCQPDTGHRETQETHLGKLNLRDISSSPHSWRLESPVYWFSSHLSAWKETFPHSILEAGEMGSGWPFVLLLPQALVTILPDTLLRFLCVGNSQQTSDDLCLHRTLQFSSMSQAPWMCTDLHIRSGKGIVSLF